MNVNLKNVLSTAQARLKKAKIESNQLDSLILLSHVLKKDKAWILSNPDFEISKTKLLKYQSLIKTRTTGEPIAYLVGYKDFFGLNFKVNKTVLIPRPDTEVMVEQTVSFINQNKAKKINVVDLGTGSGCIIISVLKNIKNSNKVNAYAVDICKRALKVTSQNATNHGLDKNIKFIQSDLLKNLKNAKIDILTANLPYLPENTYPNLKFEPSKALYAGPNGLKLYQKLFQQIEARIQKPNTIFCEISHNQTKPFSKIVKNILPEYELKIKKDLADKDRLAIIKKSNKNSQNNSKTDIDKNHIKTHQEGR